MMATIIRHPASNLDYSIQNFREAHEEHNMIGESSVMQTLYHQIERAGPTKASILILGASGTGKELIARAIHTQYEGERRRTIRGYRGTPFIPVNSASIPDDLLESTLFGYEKGAFTGAEKPTPGRFELADGGILYLDEIGDLSLRHQAKVLRAVEEGEVERLGSGNTRRVNVRMVTATNKNLERMMKQGQFREDLYYRISTIPIEAPPLNQRVGDIKLLAEYFMLEFSAEHKKGKSITQDGYKFLEIQPWRGNIRQLRNFLEHAFVQCDDSAMDSNYFAKLVEGQAGFVQLTLNPPVLSAPVDISLEGSIARALSIHANLQSQSGSDEFEKYKGQVRRIGEVVNRLTGIGERLSAAQQISDNLTNSSSSGKSEPNDYYSHRFYQEARLIEILDHIRSERVRLKYRNFNAASDSLGIGYYGLRRSVYVPLKTIGWNGDKPIVGSQSFYGTATEDEIKIDVAKNRHIQLRTIRATEKSLRVTTSTLNKLLE